MQELDDIALLKEFVERNSEDAFAVLVSRHVNHVYSIALRQTRNPGQAEEITQAVFVILARKSPSLCKGTFLSGWLHETTRLTAVTFLRSEFRRACREREACMQNLLNESAPDIWPQIAPQLDAAISQLNEKDRNVILLHYFDDKSMKEIGAALGANEEAAKKRVNRAVEKLRSFFNKRGIVASGAGTDRGHFCKFYSGRAGYLGEIRDRCSVYQRVDRCSLNHDPCERNSKSYDVVKNQDDNFRLCHHFDSSRRGDLSDQECRKVHG